VVIKRIKPFLRPRLQSCRRNSLTCLSQIHHQVTPAVKGLKHTRHAWSARRRQ